jgi:hypothetical protein
LTANLPINTYSQRIAQLGRAKKSDAPVSFGVGRRAAPRPRLLEREMILDRITGFDNRDRKALIARQPTELGVVAPPLVLLCQTKILVSDHVGKYNVIG